MGNDKHQEKIFSKAAVNLSKRERDVEKKEKELAEQQEEMATKEKSWAEMREMIMQQQQRITRLEQEHKQLQVECHAQQTQPTLEAQAKMKASTKVAPTDESVPRQVESDQVQTVQADKSRKEAPAFSSQFHELPEKARKKRKGRSEKYIACAKHHPLHFTSISEQT